MDKRRLLVIVLSLVTVFLLAVPSVVTANPRGEAAWKKYVDEKVAELYQYIDETAAALYTYVDEQIGGGGGGSGPDFDLPADEDWIVEAYAYSNPQGCYVPFLRVTTDVYGDDPTATCSWHGAALTPSFVGGSHYRSTGQAAAARGIAAHNGEVLAYGTGGCGEILFPDVQYLPEYGEAIDLDVWVFWMGTEKVTTISRTVTDSPNEPPYWDMCDYRPWHGSAPLTVTVKGRAYDNDPCDVLRYDIDFGDGTTAENISLPITHTYDAPGFYEPHLTVIDHGGLSEDCYGDGIEVE